MYEVAAIPVVALAVSHISHAFLGFVPAIAAVVLPELVVPVSELAPASVGTVTELGEFFAQL